MRWAGHEAGVSEIRNAYKMLTRKPIENKPFKLFNCRYLA
jgi:hypothetical protein